MAANVVKLPTVARSPATLQYQLPKPTATGRPIYKRVFYPNEEAKETLSQPWLRATDPMMPPYPYGRNQHFEEANHGLYGGATIQSGNKISDGRNKGKTVRKWYPNVRVERLKSKALNIEISVPTVARVMRTIRKSGGLDEYLLGEKPARIKELGLLGWKLRWMVMKSNAVRNKHAFERRRLGVPSVLDVDAKFAEVWADAEMQQSLIEKMHAGWQQLKEKDLKFKKHWKGEKDGVQELKSLELYDPKGLQLPEYVRERLEEVPVVKGGFGLLQAPTEKSGDRTGDGPGSSQPAPSRLAVNKAPGKRHQSYDGGLSSAVAAPWSPVDLSTIIRRVEASDISGPDAPVRVRRITGNVEGDLPAKAGATSVL